MMSAEEAYSAYQNKIQNLDHLSLGTFPTPVHQIKLSDGTTFWIKDDGVCSTLYGGNKVRKLEYILSEARSRKQSLIAWGDSGSHTLKACYHFCLDLQIPLELAIFPYREHSLDRLFWQGRKNDIIQITQKHSMLSAFLYAKAKQLFTHKHLIRLGTSTPYSTVGYVNAAIELHHQIQEGLLPTPKTIYVAFGTGGTVAGLLIGLALCQVPSKIVAVQCVDSLLFYKWSLKNLIHQTLQLLTIPKDFSQSVLQHLEGFDTSELGKGYRHMTSDSQRAVQTLQTHGITIDPHLYRKGHGIVI